MNSLSSSFDNKKMYIYIQKLKLSKLSSANFWYFGPLRALSIKKWKVPSAIRFPQ